MASDPSSSNQPRNNLTESGITIPSDSENYDANHELSSSPPSSSSSPLILYKPPTLWGLLRGAAINLLLPFVNGLMLGFGELVANEAAFRLGWAGTKVCACWLGDILLRATLMVTDIPESSFRFSSCGTWGRNASRSHRAPTEEWAGDGCVYLVGMRKDCYRQVVGCEKELKALVLYIERAWSRTTARGVQRNSKQGNQNLVLDTRKLVYCE